MDDNNGYDVIALSGLITTLEHHEKIAKIARDILPKSYIVAGGGLATDIKDKLFDWIPQLDAINIGPGETTIDDIVAETNHKVFFGSNPDNLDAWNMDHSLTEVDKNISTILYGVLLLRTLQVCHLL